MDVSTRKAKCDCGGLWKLDFKPPKFDLSLVDNSTWNIFRYHAFMPLEGEYWHNISLGEGMTPVIQFDDDVLLKMDYFMPTLSFKDRGAAVLIAHCKAIGVDFVAQDSSGKRSRLKIRLLMINTIKVKKLRFNLSFCFVLLFDIYFMVAAFLPAILPNVFISANAFPPSLLVPWIPPVTSPAAYNPGIIFPEVSKTCASVLISRPPIV